MQNTIYQRLSISTATILVFILLVLATACGGRKTAYIFVLDLTESVSAQARERSFAAIKLRAKSLQRGDSLTVIPINADAQTETSGNVLYLKTSEKRELADADLDEFFALAERQLNEMSTNAKNYRQSDVLGAIRVAQEEKASINPTKKRVVIVFLSDMVHSTAPIRFESDANFAKPETARKYAESVIQTFTGDFKNSEIYVGFLESSDWRKMPDARREATREFWHELFTSAGASHLQFATDGTGQLENFIAGQQNSGE